MVSAKIARESWEKADREAVDAGRPAPVMPEAASMPDKPVRPRLKVSDTTLEALGALLSAHGRGLLFHRDELSGWLGAFDKYGGAGSDRAFWSECFNGSFYVIDRKKHPEPIRIPHLNVSIIGGIQPDRLASLLLSGDDDGLPARFLMVWPEPIPPKRPRGHVDDEPAYEALRRLHRLEMGMEVSLSRPRPQIYFRSGVQSILRTSPHPGCLQATMGSCPESCSDSLWCSNFCGGRQTTAPNRHRRSPSAQPWRRRGLSLNILPPWHAGHTEMRPCPKMNGEREPLRTGLSVSEWGFSTPAICGAR